MNIDTIKLVVAIMLGLSLTGFFIILSGYVLQLRKNLVQAYDMENSTRELQIEKMKLECVEKEVVLKQHGDMVRIEEYKAHNAVNIDENTFSLLDRIIEEGVIEYEIYNLLQDKYIYVTDDIESDMISQIFTLIKERMSNTVMEQISILYDIKAIPDVILSRIKMRVLSYKIEKNSTLYNE